ncbi:phage tail protein I [Slackia piriformis]|nr:phage tail protein I [Slackia piriformis]
MVGLRLGDLEFVRLLPTWMRGDVADVALAQGVDEAVRGLAPQIAVLSVWDCLDQLPEDYLDELAWALDVRWYDSGADYETKVDLVRNSDMVHRKLGTVGAVESVVSSYFGAGRVMEWQDYDGQPHHFKVFTTDPSAVGENLPRFLDMLRKVKRLSSVFDGIMIGLTGEQTAQYGMVTKITSRETIQLGVTP